MTVCCDGLTGYTVARILEPDETLADFARETVERERWRPVRDGPIGFAWGPTPGQIRSRRIHLPIRKSFTTPKPKGGWPKPGK